MKPTQDITWATDLIVDPTLGINNKSEPPTIKKDNGWSGLEKPPIPWFNYWMNGAQLYIDYIIDEALEGTFTFNGLKTFDTIPVLPASNPTSDNQATRKGYVDDRDATLGATYVHLTGIETIAGTKTFSDSTTISDTTESSSKDNGCLVLEGGLGIEKNLNVGGSTTISDTTESSSKDNGCLVLEGGLGIEKNLNVGGIINAVGGFVADFRDSAGAESSTAVKTKILKIGDWDMNGTVSVIILHGISVASKIRHVSVLIRDDSNIISTPLTIFSDTADPSLLGGGVGSITATGITLIRRTLGYYDSSSYNSTPYNRGWIYITYEV